MAGREGGREEGDVMTFNRTQPAWLRERRMMMILVLGDDDEGRTGSDDT